MKNIIILLTIVLISLSATTSMYAGLTPVAGKSNASTYALSLEPNNMAEYEFYMERMLHNEKLYRELSTKIIVTPELTKQNFYVRNEHGTILYADYISAYKKLKQYYDKYCSDRTKLAN